MTIKKAVNHLSKADKKLSRLIEKAGPCTLKPETKRTAFEALVESVTHQQLHGKAARTIFARLLALYPNKRFPSPEDILKTTTKKLRGVGLSGSKVAAIKDIARHSIDGVVPTQQEIVKLSNEEIVERLTQIRGVGRWTAEMLLIFTLGRLDVLPVTDYGVRAGFALTYKKKDLPHPRDLEKFGELWKPYRSIASWYLWRAVDLSRDNSRTEARGSENSKKKKAKRAKKS